MTNEMIGLLGFLGLIALLGLRVPVGIAMIAVSVAGFAALRGWDVALDRLGADAFSAASVQALGVIPMFIMMGVLLAKADVGRDLYALFNRIFKRVPGNLAVATIGAGAVFGSVNGSALASASTLSIIAIPEMRARDYADKLSAGAVAVAGCLGMLIPPSAVLIFYGVLTEQSIGQLLIASLVPSLIVIVLLLITTIMIALRSPHLAPPSTTQDEQSWARLILSCWQAPALFALTIGGIYLGFFTANEAGAVGALLAAIYGLGSSRVSPAGIAAGILDTARLSASIFLIVIGGKMFAFFIAFTGMPASLSDTVLSLAIPSALTVMVIFLVYFLLGALMDELAVLVIMTPIMYPVVIGLGYDGIWFGVVSVMMLLSGLLMPPVGIVSFVVSKVSGVSLREVFLGILPYQLPLAAAVLIVTLFPGAISWLPSLMHR